MVKTRSKQRKAVKKKLGKVKKLHVVLSEVKTMKEILGELKKLNKNLENFNDSQSMLEINKTYLASIDKTLEEINFTMRSIRWSMSK